MEKSTQTKVVPETSNKTIYSILFIFGFSHILEWSRRSNYYLSPHWLFINGKFFSKGCLCPRTCAGYNRYHVWINCWVGIRVWGQLGL